ncbi:GDP-L-fucose synthase [Ruminiclostridium hungatei]|uniref:GDP-L-fucose synthase n=2 Tax=Ruminiclostridium hungatei TaxID=48256 RepID=A0A1V4SI62_RUMHU|nr:NAD-dependent epimerase/dehydratase family protein [Ruminiclostridium hungatei]OPX43579.1 GDP-L-fucose synthase [Ruminiclostridium hungatei]
MKILVTGARGFIGKNLVTQLKNEGFLEIYEYDKDSCNEFLDEYTTRCDFVFHLAGINRTQREKDFIEGNCEFTSQLLELLKKNKNNCPIVVTSSIQAELDNPYGISKKAAEEILLQYSNDRCIKVFIYRLQNVFGKWCKPNYNSVVATFCNNIASGLPIVINNAETELQLVYIDDVVKEFIKVLKNWGNSRDGYCSIEPIYNIKLGALSELLYSFKEIRSSKYIPDMSDQFVKKLYSTYLSYLPEDKFSYALKMNVDNRGSFTEFIKTPDRGQVSINISKPGITKGNHWHHTKNEKFLVVSGEGVIKFRKIYCQEIIEYYVSGNKLEVIDIPPGYIHKIINLGETDMVTVMWANEYFDPERPDTYVSEV